jgi:hypothetical protein
VFVVNSRLGLFSATSKCFDRFISTHSKAPLLPKLRGYFAEFLNEGYPAHLRILSPPTCVGLRYGHPLVSLEAFLDSVGSVSSPVFQQAPHHLSGFSLGGFASQTPYRLRREFPSSRLPTLLCHSFTQTTFRWYWNVNQLSIAYAYSPRLRSRLTLRRRALLRKP